LNIPASLGSHLRNHFETGRSTTLAVVDAPPNSSYDVAVVGGGHNGLTAAAYLAKAGLSVLVLERLDHTGGAAVSAQVFDGRPARLSRYAGLVSLLPLRVARDLDLPVELRSRSVSSYTPYVRNGRHGGLLVENPEGEPTRASFAELTGSDDEYAAWREFHARFGSLAKAVVPTLLDPLPREREIEAAVDPAVWTDFVVNPIGQTLLRTFRDDLVRGIVASDAVLGAWVSPDDPSLVANRVFLYHLMGDGTGESRVPVGGMGAVSAALERAARMAGAQIHTACGVSAIRGDHDGAEVEFHDGTSTRAVRARFVLANVAPWIVDILVGNEQEDSFRPVGSQVKIDLLLSRLPTLKSGIDPHVAFAGTLHLNQTWSAMETAYADASAGRLPDPGLGKVDCHSLTDPSVLGDSPEGTHTLSYFGVHTPSTIFEHRDRDALRADAVAAALAGINAHLAEPIEDCLARDAHGKHCLDAMLPHDVEADLAMPGGHVHHGELSWPWAPNRARLDTPAQQWGVQTDLARVLICGAGARRGGGVSGIGGHNAARAVLASL
jgi:phytoene dehydrogenase-like protein